MTQPESHQAPLHRLLWLLIAIFILGDQFSKAFFVYRLGQHQHADFWHFLAGYFTLWGRIGGPAAVGEHYGPFQPFIPVWEPWIRFNLTTNSGAAWSILEGYSFQLSFVSLAMALLLYYVWYRGYRYRLGMTWALAAIIGGALGNFADRFRLKEVVDFIAVKIPYIGKLFPALGDPYDFPIFNVADACAVCGTIALASYLILADIHSWGRPRHVVQTEPDRPSPWEPTLAVSPEALAQLKLAAASAPRCTNIGLTRHIGLSAELAAITPGQQGLEDEQPDGG